MTAEEGEEEEHLTMVMEEAGERLMMVMVEVEVLPFASKAEVGQDV